MKHLFIVRHGDYSREKLTELGKQQIQRVAQEMNSIAGGPENSHYLLSSPALRAEQSAQIIADVFGLQTFHSDERLRPHGIFDLETGRVILNQAQLDAIDGLIEPLAATYDVVTMAAHFEAVRLYSPHFMERTFGRREHVREPRKGEGVHLDLEARTFQMLPAEYVGKSLDHL